MTTPGQAVRADPHLQVVLDDVSAVLKHDAAVVFGYVFGSLARGEARGDSDIDVAVFLDPPGDLSSELRLEAALVNALGGEVDLVVLNRAPLWLQARILADAVVAFSRDEPRRIQHRAGTEIMWLDFKPVHDAYLDSVRARARERLSG